MDISDYHIATKRIHELEQELETTTALCKTLTTIVNEGMHWLPMTEDAVFEDRRDYLIREEAGASILKGWYQKEADRFITRDDVIARQEITHYARITEPR